jgi:hypothetical protein
MNKVLAILLCAAAPAWAGWKTVGESPGARSFADPSSILRKGPVAAMWSLLDFNNFQRMVEVGYFSQKALVEYDCKQRQSRGMVVSLHAEHMGEGKVVYADESPHDWEPIVPETLGEELWKVACR